MKLQSVYPLITTGNLAASRDFYVANFGLEVLFEANWVAMLGLPGRGEICLGLMSPDHPTNPPGPETFDGKGMIVTMQVEDASAVFASLKHNGTPIEYGLHDEPWGQRRFMTRDPGGVLVDVVEQTEPQAGFWDAYMSAQQQAG